ncbi:MAG: heme-binding protein [Candidatus Melainabacteria bacterium]|nr:heme-binding protein [Candidatus Melainabacteria bacterium]
MKKRLIFLGLIGAAVAAGIAQNEAVSKTEQPKFHVLESHGPIEIRQYDPTVVAEVEIAGDQKEALEAGFRVLAGYIFGKNQSNQTYTTQKIAMTAPVSQQKSEKIAMTAPVTAEAHGSIWKIRFTMPAQYSLATLPKPKDERIHLMEVAGETVAAIRFSGLASQKDMEKKAEELETFLIKNNKKSLGEPVHAYYNPPWTLPFLRRNEVLIKLSV